MTRVSLRLSVSRLPTFAAISSLFGGAVGCGASPLSAQSPATEAVVTVAPIATTKPVDPHIARAEALKDAAEFGAVGLLNAGTSDPPTATVGVDDLTTLVGVLGSGSGTTGFGVLGSGASMGVGGLGLSGVGLGGGGTGLGVGLGTIGRSGGGDSFMPAASVDAASTSTIEFADLVTLGLSADAAARTLRSQNYKLRDCFDKVLETKPTAEGTFSLRLAVDDMGYIKYVNVYSATTTAPEIASCFKEAYHKVYISRLTSLPVGIIETTLSLRPTKR